MSGTPSANSTRLIPVGPALSYIFIFMVFISPTFVPINGNSVWCLPTFTARPLYSKPFVTSCAPELVLPSVGALFDESDLVDILSFTMTVLVTLEPRFPAPSGSAVCV